MNDIDWQDEERRDLSDDLHDTAQNAQNVYDKGRQLKNAYDKLQGKGNVTEAAGNTGSEVGAGGTMMTWMDTFRTVKPISCKM